MDISSLKQTKPHTIQRPHSLRDFKMSDEPTEPPANGANTQQHFNDQALTSTEQFQTEQLADLNTAEIDQILAEWGLSFTQADIDTFFANLNVPLPPAVTAPAPTHRTMRLNGHEAIQAYLIQMQVYAGVPQVSIRPMRSYNTMGQARRIMFRVNNTLLMFPLLPPAAFTGHLAPLPDHDNIPTNSLTLEYLNGLIESAYPNGVSFHFLR